MIENITVGLLIQIFGTNTRFNKTGKILKGLGGQNTGLSDAGDLLWGFNGDHRGIIVFFDIFCNQGIKYR
jgi:hypothetical protein